MAISGEQLSAFLARLKEDASLQDKLKRAADLDAFLAIAKKAGFEISKADWFTFQADRSLEPSDDEVKNLEEGIEVGLVGGGFFGAFGEEFFFCRVNGDRDVLQA